MKPEPGDEPQRSRISLGTRSRGRKEEEKLTKFKGPKGKSKAKPMGIAMIRRSKVLKVSRVLILDKGILRAAILKEPGTRLPIAQRIPFIMDQVQHVVTHWRSNQQLRWACKGTQLTFGEHLWKDPKDLQKAKTSITARREASKRHCSKMWYSRQPR